MVELTNDQKIAVAAAQETFSNLKNNNESLNESQLNLLFGEARSMNGCPAGQTQFQKSF